MNRLTTNRRIRTQPRIICLGALLLLISFTASAIAQQTSSSSRGPSSDDALALGTSKWEIEFHGGGGLVNNPTRGTARLPAPGVEFTTAFGFSSRRISSWYFGDGALLLNQIYSNPGFAITQRITPLDPMLTTAVAERTNGHPRLPDRPRHQSEAHRGIQCRSPPRLLEDDERELGKCRSEPRKLQSDVDGNHNSTRVHGARRDLDRRHSRRQQPRSPDDWRTRHQSEDERARHPVRHGRCWCQFQHRRDAEYHAGRELSMGLHPCSRALSDQRERYRQGPSGPGSSFSGAIVHRRASRR